jgi:hypothetical protein
MIRKIFIGLILGLLLQFTNAFAQEYKNAIGIRAGLPFGISYKRYLDDHSSLEAIAGTRWKGLTTSFKYEYYNKTNIYPGLTWYVGTGGALGYYNNDSPWVDVSDYRFVFGIEAIAGIDYKFENMPISIAFDWTPLFIIVGYVDFDFLQFGISVRFLF